VYRQPARFDDDVEIATWISDVRRATAVRHYTLGRVVDGAALAEVNTLYVWVDRQTLKPIRIPPEFMADFEFNIAR
jgi:acyl-CoA thioesterase FadM